MTKLWIATCFSLLLLAVPFGVRAEAISTVPAQEGSSSSSGDAQNERLTRLEQQLASSQMSADNGWMLMCSALVLMMTGPGLALFYGGLVRKKNVLATMMQSFALMAVVTVVWAILGYSLSFGEGRSEERRVGKERTYRLSDE